MLSLNSGVLTAYRSIGPVYITSNMSHVAIRQTTEFLPAEEFFPQMKNCPKSFRKGFVLKQIGIFPQGK